MNKTLIAGIVIAFSIAALPLSANSDPVAGADASFKNIYTTEWA